MSSALILGGTGVVGAAAARRLARGGWRVTVVGRSAGRMPTDLAALGVSFVSCERSDTSGLKNLFPDSGHDLLVDCVCFTSEHAHSLLDLASGAGSTVMISSKAVYVDEAGNNVNSPVSPTFPIPITEDQPVMQPGAGHYQTREGYGSNKVAAELALLNGDQPVTVIRASKVHGPGGSEPREWVFVKRCLDRRPTVLLANEGRGVDHTTAADNLAALIEVVGRKPGKRILNSADPDAPSGLEISRVIADHLDHSFEEVLLDADADPHLGTHPWMAGHPIILDTSAALDLGYVPVGDYSDTVSAAVEWMTERAFDSDSGASLPGIDDQWFAPMLDYEREDEYLATRPSRSG